MISRRNFLILSASASVCGVCQSEEDHSRTHICTELTIKDYNLALDIAIDENPKNDPSRKGLPRIEAVSYTQKKWNPRRRILNVDFISEPSYLDKVVKFARQWEDHMGIELRFGSAEPDILITFAQGEGSWSYVGTDSLYFSSKGRPSMNFGWFNTTTSDEEFRRTVLHEFGHALSLVHEHSHPDGGISWNKAEVYKYYKRQGWSKKDVDDNIFKKYELSAVNGSAYDMASIMHYPISPAHVLNASDAVGWNTELSEKDIEVIAELYPKQLSPFG